MHGLSAFYLVAALTSCSSVGHSSKEITKEAKRRRIDDTASDEADDDTQPNTVSVVPAKTPPIEPKNPGWVVQAWNCNASANDKLRHSNGTEQMYDAARQIGRCSTEYPDQTRALTYGVIFRGFDAENRPDYCSDRYNDDVEARMIFLVWLRYFPELEDHLVYLAANPALILHLGNYVKAIAGRVRSDDLGRLNGSIVSYSMLEDPKNTLQRHSNRGFEDPRTGRLLCPVRILEEFEANPAHICSLYRDHIYKISSYDFPSFMTDLSLADPDDREAGFLRGPLLVSYYKAVFLGRSSVYSEPSSRGQPSVAVKYGMTEVNLHSIAYVTLLARSALGSDPVWRDADGKSWLAPSFLHAIMDLVCRSPSWKQSTIDWWNKQIFGTEDTDDSETERELEESDYYKIITQRAARESSKTPSTSEPPAQEHEVAERASDV
ncbi:hypothetical protein BD309DRAFT_865625 [Dichomitus squalens]|uniref:Uncharacterized protein n=1 Tax=Dichomitus squalens TaxID=114155 RepID=A0A4Q9NPV0_9APHY|nr:hypothetical protein BD309DRAFT_865625 [Dichomitus squalens]TBU62830.1 hypothetical protein BD310DRAFT_810385 [Dichomitus squalens]